MKKAIKKIFSWIIQADYRYTLLIFLFYLALSLFAFRNVCFVKGTIGHHIDWFIPPLAQQLKRIGLESFYIWKTCNLGLFSILNLTVVVEKALSWLGNLGVSGEIVSKTAPLILLALAGFSMYQLMLTIFKKELKVAESPLICFLGGIIYGFSPVAFNEIIAGHLVTLISYAIAPFVVMYYLQAVENRKIHFRAIILAALIFNFSIFHLQMLVMLMVLFLSYILFAESKFIQLKAFLKFFILSLLFQSYWLLLFLINIKVNLTYFRPLVPNGLSTIKLFLLKPIDIFTLRGYFIPWFSQIVSSGIPVIWYLTALIIIIIVFLPLIICYKNRFVIFSSCMILASFFFMGAGGNVSRVVTEWIYRHFIFMQLFRSVHYLMFIPAFFYPILIGILLVSVKKKISFQAYCCLIASLIIAILVYLYPIFTGDMGGNIQLFSDSHSYLESEDYLKDKEDYRMLYLPAAASPLFVDSKFKDVFAFGADPALMNSMKPTFVSDSARWDATKEITTLIEKALYERKNIPIFRLLNITNVKYLLVRSDRKQAWDFGASFWAQQDAYPHLCEIIKKQQRIELIKNYFDMSLWRNIDFSSHIYPSSDFTVASADIEILLPMMEMGHLGRKPVLLLTQQNQNLKVNRQNLINTDNFVFKDSNWQDLAVELVAQFTVYSPHSTVRLKKPGTYEIYVDTAEIEEEAPEYEIKVDGRELPQLSSHNYQATSRKYVKINQAKLEEGKHIINIKNQNENQNLKIVLVNKEERENLEKETWKKINHSETELCYIFEEEKREFYVP